MREIEAKNIQRTVAKLFFEANFFLPDDVLSTLKEKAQTETSLEGKSVLKELITNAEISVNKQIPLCQDCGAAVVFIDLGQDTHIVGGDLYTAINEGVRQAYSEGYLRKSMVNAPFSTRNNTQDNTPALIYTDIIQGDKIKVTVMSKGGGAENMSRLAMLTPAAGRQGVVEFVVNTVDESGSNACPPLIVGVGIGGTAERTLLSAKKALLRKVGENNIDPEIAELEKELLIKINRLGIGPMGYGGQTTALAVNVEVFPAHLASLPVAVNLSCHSSRHKEAII